MKGWQEETDKIAHALDPGQAIADDVVQDVAATPQPVPATRTVERTLHVGATICDNRPKPALHTQFVQLRFTNCPHHCGT